MEAAIRCDEDTSVRCVVLTGSGRFFCGGGDVGAFASAGQQVPGLLKELLAYLNAAIRRLAGMDKPLVTLVNGPAAGAGVSLAALGDIALAAQSAHFTLAYTGIGLTPDCGTTWWLPRLVGLRRAQELVLTNKRLSADDAQEIGLITRAVNDAHLQDAAMEVTRSLAQSATQALGHARRLLRVGLESSLDCQLESEMQSIVELARTSHAREGIAAFLEKRRPNYADEL